MHQFNDTVVMGMNENIMCALSNIFNVPMPFLVVNKSTGDINVKDTKGNTIFRLGYLTGFTFFRENPVFRELRKRGLCSEGNMEDGNEYQYDLRITFDSLGNIVMMSDQRTGSEWEMKR
jgi:hypothetical protein